MAWHRPSTVRVDLAANGPEPCQRIWKNRPLVGENHWKTSVILVGWFFQNRWDRFSKKGLF